MAKSLLTLLALGAGLVENVAAEPRVVKLPIHRAAPREVTPLRKRAGTPPTVTLANEALNYLYAVNATVGSNNQPVSLQIDTGSSDVWMFGATVCQQNSDLCQGTGSFNSSQSSTYKAVGLPGLFEIEYVTPGSGVKGDYFRDTFALTGSSIKLTNMTMAVATSAKAVNMGIMGIGFTDDESIYSNSRGTVTYPSIIDVMYNESVIASHSYSLYLDDLEASTGSIIFGGYDTNKYNPPLTVLDVQPDSQTDAITSFTVAWSFIGVTDGSGSTLVNSNSFPLPAVLDSGTSLTVIPPEIFIQLAGYFNATNLGDEYGWVVPCASANSPGSVDFGFGSTSGPVIQVPFSELYLPAVNDNGKQLTYPGSKDKACAFGFSPSSQGDPILFGDTFLRSAYVVYDLEAQQVAIAQTNFNSGSSNVQEIGAGNDLASILGSAATSASASTVTQTATNDLIPGLNTQSAQSLPSSGTGKVSSLSGAKTTFSVHTTVTVAGASNTAGSGSGASSNRVFHASGMPVWASSLIGLFVSGVAMVAFF